MYYNSRRINYLAAKLNMSLLRLARYDNGSATKMGVFCSRKENRKPKPRLFPLQVVDDAGADVGDEAFGGVGGAADGIHLQGSGFGGGEAVPDGGELFHHQIPIGGCLGVGKGLYLAHAFLRIQVDEKGRGAETAFIGLEGGGIDGDGAVGLLFHRAGGGGKGQEAGKKDKAFHSDSNSGTKIRRSGDKSNPHLWLSPATHQADKEYRREAERPGQAQSYEGKQDNLAEERDGDGPGTAENLAEVFYAQGKPQTEHQERENGEYNPNCHGTKVQIFSGYCPIERESVSLHTNL